MRIGDPDAPVRADVNAGGDSLGSGNFFGAESCWIETCESAWIAEDPDGAIGSEDHFAGDGAIEAVLRFPCSPAVRLGIPHGDATVGADPEAIAGIAQFGPHDIVGETLRLRPARPSFPADPALDACSAETDPVCPLAIFGDGKRGVDGHSAALVNHFPLAGDSAIEACHSRNHQIAGTVQSRRAIVVSGRKIGKLGDEVSRTWVEAIEMRGGANPEDLLEVLEDADHLFVRQAAFRGKHVDMVLRIEPAHAVS